VEEAAGVRPSQAAVGNSAAGSAASARHGTAPVRGVVWNPEKCALDLSPFKRRRESKPDAPFCNWRESCAFWRSADRAVSLYVALRRFSYRQVRQVRECTGAIQPRGVLNLRSSPSYATEMTAGEALERAHHAGKTGLFQVSIHVRRDHMKPPGLGGRGVQFGDIRQGSVNPKNSKPFRDLPVISATTSLGVEQVLPRQRKVSSSTST